LASTRETAASAPIRAKHANESSPAKHANETRRAKHACESMRVRPVAPRSSPSLIKSWDPRIARPNSPESASPHLATVITKSARHPCKGAIRPKWNLTRMVCKIKQKEDRSVKLVVNPDRGGDRLDGWQQPAITRPLRTTRAGVPGTGWPKSRGRMAEWFKAPVLKTGRGFRSLVGSNPTPSASPSAAGRLLARTIGADLVQRQV
jgi:hypothetical protein